MIIYDDKLEELSTQPTDEELFAAFEQFDRKVYTIIQNLTKEEEIQGQVLGSGSISVNGSSALRRTISGLTLQTSEGAAAQDYNWVLTDQIRIYQGISNAKTGNKIWYFNLGTYCLSTFSANESLQGTKINISGKDLMVLLNGESGGTFTVDTELSTGKSDSPSLEDIIIQVVTLAGIAPDKINVFLEDTTGRELLEYRGSDPLYLYGEVTRDSDSGNIVETISDFTILGDSPIYKNASQQGEISKLSWGSQLEGGGDGVQPSYSNYVNKIYGPGRNGYNQTQYVARVTNGQVAGYKVVKLTYPGELKAAAGETVVSILDKIVNALGKEYEYFFDVDGEFYFQKKNALLSMTRASGSNTTLIFEDKKTVQGVKNNYQISRHASWEMDNTNFPFVRGNRYKITVTGRMEEQTGADNHIGIFFVYRNSSGLWLGSSGEINLRRDPDNDITATKTFVFNPPTNCSIITLDSYYRKPSGDGIPEDERADGCTIKYISVAPYEAQQAFEFSHADTDETTPIYTYNDKKLLTSFNRQPKIENIKNDFTIWGARPSQSGGEGVPIHARYIIDEPFKYYSNWEDNIEKDGEYWKWTAGVTKETTTTLDQQIICEQLYQMATHRGEGTESYPLVPEGKEYYKQLFPDIRYFWREIYNPEEEGTFYSTNDSIVEGSMKPTHWFGNTIPEGYESDYDNIYTQKESVALSAELSSALNYWNVTLSDGLSIFDLLIDGTIIKVTFDVAYNKNITQALNFKGWPEKYPQDIGPAHGYPIYINGKITSSENAFTWTKANQSFYFKYVHEGYYTSGSTTYDYGHWEKIDQIIAYTSLTDTIDLSDYTDIYEANGNSLYDKTGYANRSLVYQNQNSNNSISFVSFYDYVNTSLGPDITTAKSFYYREIGKSNYLPLYEQLPISFAKPHFTGEKWDNKLALLCYQAADSETLTLVESIEKLDGTVVSILSNGQTNLATILQGNIEKYNNNKTPGANSQFVLLQPKYTVMKAISDTPTFSYKNYSKYSFYIKETIDGKEKYIPWIEKTTASKNTWRFVIESNESGIVTVEAPLNTISYNKNQLYSNSNGSGLLTPPEEIINKTGNIYLYTQNSTADKIPLTAGSVTSFTYLPCDWNGRIKTKGAISKTKHHPVFVKQWEFDAATHKNLAYASDPVLLPFELVWINPPEDDELANCTISKIGQKILVKNEKGVTSLNYSETPPLYFTTNPDDNLYMNTATEKLFVLSSQGISAADYIKSLLFDHAYCNETATVNTIPLYFLEPNKYIEIIEDDITYYYILSSFSIPLSYNGTMSLTLTRDKLARN